MLVGAVFVGAVACGVSAGCGKREPAHEETAPETIAAESEPAPLARVGSAVITEADFEFELRRRRESGAAVHDAESLLKELIQREAMLQESARADWMDEPGLRRERENLRLSQWLDRTLRQEKERISVGDDELRAHYDAHVADHTMPALVRLAILYRKNSSREPAAVDALSASLREVRRRFLEDRETATQKGRIPGFGTLSAEASEDAATRYRGGDLGWLEPSRADARWPAAVLAAGFALPNGDVSDVIAVGDELYIVMKQSERAARVEPFEQIAIALRRRMVREKQESLEREFMDGVLSRAGVEVNRERASRLVVPNVVPSSRSPSLFPAGDGSALPHVP